MFVQLLATGSLIGAVVVANLVFGCFHAERSGSVLNVTISEPYPGINLASPRCPALQLRVKQLRRSSGCVTISEVPSWILRSFHTV
jgi:hypothetical protein